MPAASLSVDNRSDLRPDRIASPGVDGAVQVDGAGQVDGTVRVDGAVRMVPGTGTVQPVVESSPARLADFAPVEGFLHLLARAIRQFHTYPPTSPLCTGAIAACHKALTSIEYRDRLALRVTP